MTAEVDVNGGGAAAGEVSVPAKDLPNGNANADGGLVFVNGSRNGNVSRDHNDDVSGDLVKTDLNSDSGVGVVVVESELGNDKPVVESRESVVGSESGRVEENGEEKIEVSHIEEKQESPVIVNDGDGANGEVDRENEVLDSSSNSNGVGENPNSDVDTELVVVESANDDQPQDSIVLVGDLVDGDQCTPQEIEPEPVEIAESVPSLINDSADLPVQPACENENENEAPDMTREVPEANSTEEAKIDLKESVLCPEGEGEVEFESQVVGGSAADYGVPGLDTGHTQDVIPETIVSVNLDANQEEKPELGDTSEIAAESLPSPVVSENVNITTAELGDSSEIATESSPSPVVSDNVSIENGQSVPAAHPVDDAKLDILDVGDTVSSDGLNNNAKSEIGTGFDSNVPEDSNLEPKVAEGVADADDTVSIGLNKDAESEIDPNNDAGSEPESVSVEKVSTADDLNVEPQFPEGVVENGPVCNDLNNDLRSETEVNVLTHSNVSEEKVSTLPMSDSSIEPKVLEGVAESEVETKKASTFSSEESSMETKVPEVTVEGVDGQSICVDNAALEGHTDADHVIKENTETEIEKTTSVVSSRDVPCEEVVDSESGGQNGSVRNPVQVENGEIQPTGEESDDKTQAVDGINSVEAPASATESSVASSEAQNVVTEAVTTSEAQSEGSEVVKRPFYCLIKVPRLEDDNLKEQIKSFQLKVDEKTRSRDAIRDTIHTRRATFKESGENLEAAISEEKAAREMLKSKRQEIDSLQSVINKVKNAISVEDIDGRIRQMRHMIEHETLPLKEEKQLIREIEQLKQQREQFSSSMGKQDEIQQAFDQKDKIEERLKVLRKEADSLRENVSKAEAATQAARKKHKDESEKLRELQSQFKAADDTRQEAYKNLQSLRKQAYDKNKYFWKYKDDVKAANDLLSKGDKEALLTLCDNQVESVLEMWNNNDEFRKEYVRCNTNSTLRRLKTLDGRSLGPNEEPPVIRSVVINRVTRGSSASQISTVKEEKPELVVPVKTEKENKSMAKVGVENVQAAKSQRPAKPVPSENGSATVSGRRVIEEAREVEPKRTKEEEEVARKAEELARKAEELRKKEEAAKLQEQRRLEEKVKAKEALERKKRIAEKAQARAALRAQKEAEQKEKEREKKARKKEKSKVGAVEDTSVTNEEESAPSTETPTETPTLSDVKDKSTTVTKKPQKPAQFTKQTKSKSIPLPLRNRGRRRMQSWMWVLIAALVVFALFLLGNSSFSYKSGLQWFGF